MPKILQNVRENILLESKELLINSNYDSFNIRELSSKCNLSVGTIYNYFPNKATLISAIFQEDWNKSLTRLKDINNNYSSLNDKLYKLYCEIDNFLSDYLVIFIQMTNNPKLNAHPTCLTILSPILDEILEFERAKGTLTSKLSNEKLNKILTNNLILLCTNKTITFEELFSLINL